MSIGDVLLLLSALAALVAFTAGGLRLRREDGRLDLISRYASLVSFAFLSAVLALLIFLFLTSDLSYAYVWSHSSTGLDPFYKLVGTWAGGEGGLVLWAWFMALSLSVEVLWERKRGLSPEFGAAFRMGMGSMVLLFSLILLAAGLFEPTNTADLALNPNGLGMDMALRTIEMALHPPLIFGGYAFCAVIFSASLARFLTGEMGWTRVALPWAWLTGVVLSVGIVVGAVWAYLELGWGGFWVWDPVETASLLPWLTIIAFLHAYRSEGARNGPLLPFLGMLSFVLVILTAFITRSGGLWGSSVHTYGSGVEGTIGTRFITVLMGDKSILGLFIVIVLLFALTIFLSNRMKKQENRKKVEGGVLTTVALLMIYVALLLLLLVKNAGMDQGANFVEFTEKTTFLTVVIMAVLVTGMMRSELGSRRSIYLGAAVGIASILAAVVASLTGVAPWILALIVPPAVAVMAVSAYRIGALGRSGLRRWMRRAGPHIVHAGIALVLLSFITTSTLQTSLPGGVEAMSVGGEVTIDGHVIRLIDLSTEPWMAPDGGEGEKVTATFEIVIGGSTRTAEVSNHYANISSDLVLQHAATLVLPGLTEDLYLSFEWMGSNTILLQARVLPMVSGVWFGAALVIAGMVMMAALAGRERQIIS
jgi:cytochrome c-type biogenesis protein CcmF